MKKGIISILAILLCLGMLAGCAEQSNAEAPNTSTSVTDYCEDPTTGDSSEENPTVNTSDAYAKLVAYKTEGYSQKSVSEFNSSLLSELGSIYDFLFIATYYLEYEIISPDTVTIAERDHVLSSLGEELQAYVDSLCESELSGTTIEKDLTDRALTILQDIVPEGMTVSCEIQIDK